MAYTSHGERIFSKLTIGDILFMYENQEGITAVGRVTSTWDGINLGRLDETVYANESLIYQIKVNWTIKIKENPIKAKEIKALGFKQLFNRTDFHLDESLGDKLLQLAQQKAHEQ